MGSARAPGSTGPPSSTTTAFYNRGLYLRDALREAVEERTWRLLEALQRLVGRAPAARAKAIDEWTEAWDDSWLMPSSACDDDSCLCHELIARARDGPDGTAEAA